MVVSHIANINAAMHSLQAQLIGFDSLARSAFSTLTAEPAVKSPENRKFGKPGINFDFEGKPAAGVDFVRVLMQFPMVILNFLRFGYVFVLNAQD